MIQRSERHKRRRSSAVILIIGVIAIIMGCSSQITWNSWSNRDLPGKVRTLANGGNTHSIPVSDTNLTGSKPGGSGGVQTAGGNKAFRFWQAKPPVPAKSAVSVKQPPIQAVSLDKPTAVHVQYQAVPGSKLVAITLDDGPDNRYTPAILDILKAYKVKATFFTVGTQIKKYPAIMKRIAAEGHCIGNHTYNHPDLTKKDSNAIKNQLKWTDTLIQQTNGFVPHLVRAPYGAVSPLVKQIVSQNDRELIGWTVDTDDWAGISTAAMRVNVNKNTHPGGIILMHSFGSKRYCQYGEARSAPHSRFAQKRVHVRDGR